MPPPSRLTNSPVPRDKCREANAGGVPSCIFLPVCQPNPICFTNNFLSSSRKPKRAGTIRYIVHVCEVFLLTSNCRPPPPPESAPSFHSFIPSCFLCQRIGPGWSLPSTQHPAPSTPCTRTFASAPCCSPSPSVALRLLGDAQLDGRLEQVQGRHHPHEVDADPEVIVERVVAVISLSSSSSSSSSSSLLLVVVVIVA